MELKFDISWFLLFTFTYAFISLVFKINRQKVLKSKTPSSLRSVFRQLTSLGILKRPVAETHVEVLDPISDVVIRDAVDPGLKGKRRTRK